LQVEKAVKFLLNERLVVTCFWHVKLLRVKCDPLQITPYLLLLYLATPFWFSSMSFIGSNLCGRKERKTEMFAAHRGLLDAL
jgi:hypothetical protein